MENLTDILPPPPSEGSGMSDLFDPHHKPLEQTVPVEFLPTFAKLPVEIRGSITDERRTKARAGAVALNTIIDLNETIVEAHIDPVTGLRNRRAYENELPRIFERKDPGDLTVLYIDLNGLKRVNDISHDMGDKYLATTAESIETGLRPTDLVYRIGGDEIVALLDGKIDEESLKVIIERLKVRQADALTPIDGFPHDAHVGLAIGGVTKQDSDTVETLVHRADMATAADKERFYADLQEKTGINFRR